MPFSQGNQQFRLHRCIFYLCWSEWRVCSRRAFRRRASPLWRTASSRVWSWKASTRSILPCTSSWPWLRWATRAIIQSVCRSQRPQWATLIDKSRLIHWAVRAGWGSGGLLWVLLLLTCVSRCRCAVTGCGSILTVTLTATTSGWTPILPTSTRQAGARARESTSCTLQKVRGHGICKPYQSTKKGHRNFTTLFILFLLYFDQIIQL